MIEYDEMQQIKTDLYDHFKNVFVLQDECNDRHEKINGKFANDDKRIDLIIQNLKHTENKLIVNNWLTFAVLGAIITLVIGFFGR